jgi:hypothetical protein
MQAEADGILVRVPVVRELLTTPPDESRPIVAPVVKRIPAFHSESSPDASAAFFTAILG